MQTTREEFKNILDEYFTVARASLMQSQENTPFETIPLTLDLSVAVTRENARKIGFPYKCLYVAQTTDTSVQINFIPDSNDTFQGAVPLTSKDVLQFDQPKADGYLYWDAQAGKTATIILFVRGVFNSGSFLTTVIGAGQASSFNQKAIVSIGIAATSIIAANSARSKLRLQNVGGDIIYIGGDNTVTALTGLGIGPGESLLLEQNSSAFWGISPTAGTDLKIIEEV